MKTLKFQQNTPEWHQWREHKVTGKSANKLLVKEKVGATEMRELCKTLYPDAKAISKMKVNELELAIREKMPSWTREQKVAPSVSNDMATWDDLQWDLLASQLFKASELYEPGENPAGRGQRLEVYAQAEFAGKHNVDVVNIGGIQADEMPVSASTDGYALFEKPHNHKVYLEIKCLRGGKHLKAFYHEKIGMTADQLLSSFGASASLEQVLQIFVIYEKYKKVCVVFYNPDMLQHEYKELWINRADYKKEINAMIESVTKRIRVAQNVADKLLGIEL